MEKFAGYGFNKSHAAAYSLLAYHTAWLKVHCTAEFFCANMTVEMDDTDKLKVLLRRREVRHPLRAARRQPRATASSRWPTRHPLRPGRRQGHRAGRHRGHRRRARRAWGAPATAAGRSAACSTSAPASTAARQQAHGGGADQGRRLRPLHPTAPRCWPAWPGLRLGRHAAGQRAAGWAVRLRPDDGDAHGSSTQEPALVAGAEPGACASACCRRRRRSASTSAATCSTPVRRRGAALCKRPIAELWTAASRSCWPASSAICASSTASAARWRSSSSTTAASTSRPWCPTSCSRRSASWLAEDELLVVQGKVQPDRFSGGLRLNVPQAVGPGRRARALRPHLAVAVNGGRAAGGRRAEACGRHGAWTASTASCCRAWRCGCGCSGPARWPNSTSATTPASGPATRRWRAGRRWRRAGAPRSSTTTPRASRANRGHRGWTGRTRSAQHSAYSSSMRCGGKLSQLRQPGHCQK
jgi:DNA polymerase III subunit alpha